VITEVSRGEREIKKFATIPALKPAEGIVSNAVSAETK
jgi:hypothetical protein